jgi:hypothetical protein
MIEAQHKNRVQIWGYNFLTITHFTKWGEVFLDKVVLKIHLSHFCEIHSHILGICATKE